MIGILVIRLFTAYAIPGWATTAMGITSLLFTNALLLATMFVFFVLSGRTSTPFIPLRDFGKFVDSVEWLRAGK
jgi:hypothetical protein